MAKTKEQEQASLTTFYYAIEKGASLEPDVDEELKSAIFTVYPDCPDSWYNTFLKQARSLIKWLGHSEGSKDKTYLYARWGKGGKSEKVSTIPRDRRTDIGDWIFEQFNKTQKQLFGSGTGVKDSWNPMDVYIVKKSDEASIKDSILCCIKAEIAPDSRDAAEMEVASINRYMAYLAREKIFVGISLKESDRGDPKVTETNMSKVVTDIPHSCGMLLKPLNTWMEVTDTKGNKGADFRSNSLTFDAEFNIGSAPKKYKYESKVGSILNHATEPRDLVQGTRSDSVPAKARNGAIPVPKMAKIVEKYSNEKINFNIPMAGEEFTDAQIKYWGDYLSKLKKDNTVKKEFGKFSIKLGKTNLNNLTPLKFIQECAAIDSTFKEKRKDFPLKFRSKLRLLRYMKMFVESKKNHKFDNLIAELYLASAKINITQEDLSGAFIKIQ